MVSLPNLDKYAYPQLLELYEDCLERLNAVGVHPETDPGCIQPNESVKRAVLNRKVRLDDGDQRPTPAPVPVEEWVAVSRAPKVGDTVRITHITKDKLGGFDVGDLLTVLDVDLSYYEKSGKWDVSLRSKEDPDEHYYVWHDGDLSVPQCELVEKRLVGADDSLSRAQFIRFMEEMLEDTNGSSLTVGTLKNLINRMKNK